MVDHLPREPPGPRARPRQVLSRRLLVVTLLALVAAVIAVRALGLADLVRLEDLARLRDRIGAFGAWAPVVFVLGYVVAVVAFIPALPLTILGGLAFGTAWGTVYVAIAATTGACLSFLIARYAARAAVERWMAAYPALARMDRAVARHGFRIVMITRLVPIFPFNLQNYAYGLTSIGFGAYAVTSFLCMLPATVAYTAAAGAIVAGAWDARRMLVLLALAGVLLVALSMLPRWLRGRSAALDDLLRTE
ncbi:MAG: TVP38/TMEM64 family protein [Candidatus Rokuibacteriota bacterium]